MTTDNTSTLRRCLHALGWRMQYRTTPYAWIMREPKSGVEIAELSSHHPLHPGFAISPGFYPDMEGKLKPSGDFGATAHEAARKALLHHYRLAKIKIKDPNADTEASL